MPSPWPVCGLRLRVFVKTPQRYGLFRTYMPETKTIFAGRSRPVIEFLRRGDAGGHAAPPLERPATRQGLYVAADMG